MTEITAHDVADYVECPFLVYCNTFVSKEERDPEDTFQTYLAEVGKAHEKGVIAQLHPDAEILKGSPEELKKLTLEAIKNQVNAITNAWIDFEGLHGKVDLLEKQGRHYVVIEIKSAKNIKLKHIMQGAFYNYILGKIQKQTPKNFYLINSESKKTEYRFDEYEQDLLVIIEKIKLIKNKELKPLPVYSKSLYPWAKYSQKQALKENDLTIIKEIGETARNRLINAGYKTPEDIANAKPEDLMKIKGIGEGFANNYVRNAKVLVAKKPIIYNEKAMKLPDKMPIYIDFESTTETEELPPTAYLLGVYTDEYIPFIAENLETGEKDLLNNFIEWLKKQNNFVLYTYSNFEVKEFKRLFEKYKTPKQYQDLILKNIFDLITPFKKGVAMPTHSNSIKDIARYLGFNWRQTDVNGTNSMLFWHNYVEHRDKDALKKFLTYNEDDVIAMKVCKDWIDANKGQH